MQQFFGDIDESDGNTEDDEARCEAFIQYRKGRREWNRKFTKTKKGFTWKKKRDGQKTGAQFKRTPGASQPSTAPQGAPPFTPWWKKGDGGGIKGFRPTDGKGAAQKGGPRFWNQNPKGGGGKGGPGKGFAKGGKFGGGYFVSMLSWMTGQGAYSFNWFFQDVVKMRSNVFSGTSLGETLHGSWPQYREGDLWNSDRLYEHDLHVQALQFDLVTGVRENIPQDGSPWRNLVLNENTDTSVRSSLERLRHEVEVYSKGNVCVPSRGLLNENLRGDQCEMQFASRRYYGRVTEPSFRQETFSRYSTKPRDSNQNESMSSGQVNTFLALTSQIRGLTLSPNFPTGPTSAVTSVLEIDAETGKLIRQFTTEQFIGIVGREPCATRSVLVDTGASINLHGVEWLQGLCREVLDPCRVNTRRTPATAKIGGVGDNKSHAREMVHVPSAILAYDKWKRAVVIYANFVSHEIPGNCPALLCYASMYQWRMKVITFQALLEVEFNGESYWIPCQPTNSGHLLMPIDNWEVDTSEKRSQNLSSNFETEVAYLEMYFDDAYHGVNREKQGDSSIPEVCASEPTPSPPETSTEEYIPTIEEFLGGTEIESPDDEPITLAVSSELVDWQQEEAEAGAYLNDRGFRWKDWQGTKLIHLNISGADVLVQGETQLKDILERPLGMTTDEKHWDHWEFHSEFQWLTWWAYANLSWRNGFPVDYNTGWDIGSPTHQETLLRCQEVHVPLWVTFAPRTWPQRIANRSDAKTRKFLTKKERRNSIFVLTLVERQVAGGRCFVIVVPMGTPWADAETIEEIERLSFGGQGRITHLCAHGLIHPASGLPHKKPHLVYSNEDLPNTIRLCPGTGKHAEHHRSSSGQQTCDWKCDVMLRNLFKDMKQTKQRRRDNLRREAQSKRGQCLEDIVVFSGSDTDDEFYEGVITEPRAYPIISCQRCKARVLGKAVTAPHTRAQGCLLRQLPHRSPARSWAKAKAAPNPLPKGVPKAKAKPAAKTKAAAAPKAATRVATTDAATATRRVRIQTPALTESDEDEAMQPREASSSSTEGVKKSTEDVSRVDSTNVDLTVKEENERNLTRTQNPRHILLFEEMIKHAGEMKSSESKFYYIPNEGDDDADVTNKRVLPEDIGVLLNELVNKLGHFKLRGLLLVRLPKRRHTSHGFLTNVGWRMCLFLMPNKQVAVESWTQVNETSTDESTARLVYLEPTWAVFVYGNYKRMRARTSPEKVDEEDIPNLRIGPVSLGKLTKFLTSRNEKVVMRGLKLLHERFTHAPVREMKTLVIRAGIDISDELIERTHALCRPCRLWSKPPPPPKSSMKVPADVNQVVECDFKFYKGSPIFHMIDKLIRLHFGDETVDRSTDSIKPLISTWLTFLGPMDQLFCDKEGAMKGDEMGIWLARRNVKRELVPKESHLGLVERHGELLVDVMRRLEAACEQEGMKLTVKELAWEAFAAKNGTISFGGMAPHQGVTGKASA